ncbi:MAG: cell division protein ZapB [Bacteroidales bacterium]
MPKTKALDLDAIDRLEAKVKMLVDLVGQMRAEQAQLKDDNVRLGRELEAAHDKLAEAESTASEFTLLKEERDAIRTRVADMLEQLEALSI